MTQSNTPITIAYGDGVGPEVMEATLLILQESGAPVHCEIIELGARMYERGHTTGITSDGWESLMRTKLLLKGPLLPPPPHPRNKDFDIVLAKSLGLFARITPIRSFAPQSSANTQAPSWSSFRIMRRVSQEALNIVKARMSIKPYVFAANLAWISS
jgi:isocitrate/isopropylmalate dehydrogenase